MTTIFVIITKITNFHFLVSIIGRRWGRRSLYKSLGRRCERRPMPNDGQCLPCTSLVIFLKSVINIVFFIPKTLFTYKTLENATCELMWMLTLFKDLHIQHQQPSSFAYSCKYIFLKIKYLRLSSILSF